MNENEKELIEQEAKRRFPVDAPLEEMEFKIPSKMYRHFLRYAFKEGAQFNHNLAKQSVEQEAKRYTHGDMRECWQASKHLFRTDTQPLNFDEWMKQLDGKHPEPNQ